MNLLITGASSMLGSSLAPHLESLGHKVIRHGYQGNSDISCDLLNIVETASMLNRIEPDIVINLVGATNVDVCERDINTAYLLNVRSVENLVAGLETCNNAFMVHVSTDQVYDSFGDSAESAVRLTNIYAMSKYAGELAALRIPAAVIRTNFFGPSQNPNKKSFSDWLLHNFQNQIQFTAFNDVMFSPLLMDTLSDAIDRVISNPLPGIFNLGSRDGMSKADFALALAESMNFSVERMQRASIAGSNLAAYRPRDMRMNSSKFEHFFGIKVPSLSDEIKRLKVA